MRTIRDKTFQLEHVDGGVVSNVRLERCVFQSCGLSFRTKRPEDMVHVSNVEIVDCQDVNSWIGPCHATDVRVEGLQTGDILVGYGVVLTRVTLAGKIGRLKLNDRVRDVSPEMDRRFREARREHYASVDWALDISRAKVGLLDLEGIPSAKVRRDPETQIVVTKDLLHAEEQLAAVEGLDATTRFVLESFVASDAPEKVLVAPMGAAKKTCRPVLASFGVLRKAGLALDD